MPKNSGFLDEVLPREPKTKESRAVISILPGTFGEMVLG
jgi:hypothetical protein